MNHTAEETREVFVFWLRKLALFCEEFDKGETLSVLLMSVALRNLLKTTKRMKSLKDQMGLVDNNFIDTRKPEFGMSFYEIGSGISNMTVLSRCDTNTLLLKVCLSKNPNGVVLFSFKPLLNSNMRSVMVPFDDWYNQVIYKVNGLVLTRKGLIESIAEQDGGAHFDKELTDEQYIQLKERKALHLLVNGVEVEFENNPAFVSLRQIAYEVLRSLTDSEISSL